MDAVVVKREADEQRIHAEHILEVGHDRNGTARALPSAGLSNDSWSGGASPKFPNSTLQSAGSRALTKARKASRIFSGSCSPTSRNETFALASPGMTVLAPSPV